MAITKAFLDGCPDSNRLLKILCDAKVSESLMLIMLSFFDMLNCSEVMEMT
jgi:hypothetical protein